MRTICHIKPTDTKLTVTYETPAQAVRTATAIGPMPREGGVVEALAALRTFVPVLCSLTKYLTKKSQGELEKDLTITAVSFTEHKKKGRLIVVSAKLDGEVTNSPSNLNTPPWHAAQEGEWETKFTEAQDTLVEEIDAWIDKLPPEAIQTTFDDAAGPEDTTEADAEPDDAGAREAFIEAHATASSEEGEPEEPGEAEPDPAMPDMPEGEEVDLPPAEAEAAAAVFGTDVTPPGTTDADAPSGTQEGYQCDECFDLFTDEDAYQQHLRTHPVHAGAEA